MLASSVMPQLAPAQHAALCRRQPLGTVRLTTRVRGGAPSHAAHLRGGAPSRTLRPACASAGGDWAVEYLVDMECPLRRAEVDSLKGIDRNVRLSAALLSCASRLAASDCTRCAAPHLIRRHLVAKLLARSTRWGDL
jgi:hypothetical protein